MFALSFGRSRNGGGGSGRSVLSAVVWTVFFCLTVGSGGVNAAEADNTVHFRWAFGALLMGSGSDRKLEPVTGEASLRSGDQFKMMVELKRPCYVYLIYHNNKDGVRMLFPYILDQFNTDYQVGKKYYIPQGDAWFELDQHVGRENFYLLAAGQRLTSLEGLFQEYETDDPAKRSEIIKKILEEIRLLKKQHRELAAPAERPVPIGGVIRGLEIPQGGAFPDVAALADDIASAGYVARTYSIEHQ